MSTPQKNVMPPNQIQAPQAPGIGQGAGIQAAGLEQMMKSLDTGVRPPQIDQKISSDLGKMMSGTAQPQQSPAQTQQQQPQQSKIPGFQSGGTVQQGGIENKGADQGGGGIPILSDIVGAMQELVSGMPEAIKGFLGSIPNFGGNKSQAQQTQQRIIPANRMTGRPSAVAGPGVTQDPLMKGLKGYGQQYLQNANKANDMVTNSMATSQQPRPQVAQNKPLQTKNPLQANNPLQPQDPAKSFVQPAPRGMAPATTPLGQPQVQPQQQTSFIQPTPKTPQGLQIPKPAPLQTTPPVNQQQPVQQQPIQGQQSVTSQMPTLGSLSAKYETSGRGPGMISTGYGDKGGMSYGSYQLASKAGSLNGYLKNSKFGSQFKGLRPNSPAFKQKWKQLAKSNPQAFHADQHNYIKKTHFDPMRSRANKLGIPNTNAVNQVLWSTSVQHGPGWKGIKRAWRPGMSESQFINNVYRQRAGQFQRSRYYNSNAKRRRVRSGVLNRFRNENRDALRLIGRQPKMRVPKMKVPKMKVPKVKVPKMSSAGKGLGGLFKGLFG